MGVGLPPPHPTKSLATTKSPSLNSLRGITPTTAALYRAVRCMKETRQSPRDAASRFFEFTKQPRSGLWYASVRCRGFDHRASVSSAKLSGGRWRLVHNCRVFRNAEYARTVHRLCVPLARRPTVVE